MFLGLSTKEIADGRLAPLPSRFPGKVLERDEIGVVRRADDRLGMNGGVMLACADILRYWESVNNDIGRMVEDGDSPVLCDIVDDIVGRIAGDTMTLGWGGTS